MYDDPSLKAKTIEETDKVLKFDALQAANDLTGGDYKEDAVTQSLGFLLHLSSGKNQDDLMKGNKDSYRGMSFIDYLALVKSLGFMEIYSKPFQYEFGTTKITEQFKVFWRNGILLVVDSWNGKLNSAKIYFQYKKKLNPVMEGSLDSGGGWSSKSKDDFNKNCDIPILHPLREKIRKQANYSLTKECDELYLVEKEWMKENNFIPVYDGNKDVQLGLKHELSKIEMMVDVLPSWESIQFLWLLNYGDENSEEFKSKETGNHFIYQEINLRVMRKFPEEIQKAIRFDDYVKEALENSTKK